jgi:hypothetical protein
VPKRSLDGEQHPVQFHVEAARPSGAVVEADRESVFIGPRR